MIKNIYLVSISMMLFSAIASAEANERTESISDYTYKECLRDTIQKNQNLSADDIRSLCKEITARPDPHYKYINGKLVPSNDFTRCYEKTREQEAKNGTKDADEIAKLLCHYAPK